MRYLASKRGDYKPKLPDMMLYSMIIFLQHYCKDKKWVVENVKPYYKPLIEAKQIGRHLFWSNFEITDFTPDKERNHNKVTGKTIIYGFDLTGKKFNYRKDQIIRNCVNPKTAKHIFDCMLKA